MSWENKYDYVIDAYEGRCAVEVDDKCGHVDKNGKVITPLIYDFVANFLNGKARVRINSGHGYVNKSGVVIEGWHNLIKGAFE